MYYIYIYPKGKYYPLGNFCRIVAFLFFLLKNLGFLRVLTSVAVSHNFCRIVENKGGIDMLRNVDEMNISEVQRELSVRGFELVVGRIDILDDNYRIWLENRVEELEARYQYLTQKDR